MRVSTLASLALVTAVGTSAAPIAIGSVVSQYVAEWRSTLAAHLRWLGAPVESNASQHGPVIVFNNTPVTSTQPTQSHRASWQSDNKRDFPGWRHYKANGVNLGGWLEVEVGNDPNIYTELGCPGVPDEWTCCATIGKAACGAALEKRYASFITTADIDRMARYGINTVRVPTNYATWIDVPGSELYHGDQLKYLKVVTDHAIELGMHVILDMHSLPGGSNGLDIGEAQGHLGWWYNATNFAYSLDAVQAMIDFIQCSANPRQFTIEPANEVGDQGVPAVFGPGSISYPDGIDYYNTYAHAVYALIQRQAPYIPLMVHDAFHGAQYWAPFWNAWDNVAFDEHHYFFAVPNVTGAAIPGIVCSQAPLARTTFPVFVGEWSLQASGNNTLAGRRAAYGSQLSAYAEYLTGSAFWAWSAVNDTTPVDGEGVKQQYWNLELLIDEGVVEVGGKVSVSAC